MARAPSSDGRDLHTLISAPGLHLESLCQHLSSLVSIVSSDDDAEEILIDISVLTALQDIEPIPASEDEKEIDRLETKERSLLNKTLWGEEDESAKYTNRIYDIQDSQSTQDLPCTDVSEDFPPEDHFAQASATKDVAPRFESMPLPEVFQKAYAQRQTVIEKGRPNESPPSWRVHGPAERRVSTRPAWVGTAGPSTKTNRTPPDDDAVGGGLEQIKKEAQMRFARQLEERERNGITGPLEVELPETGDWTPPESWSLPSEDAPPASSESRLRDLIAVWQVEGLEEEERVAVARTEHKADIVEDTKRISRPLPSPPRSKSQFDETSRDKGKQRAEPPPFRFRPLSPIRASSTKTSQEDAPPALVSLRGLPDVSATDKKAAAGSSGDRNVLSPIGGPVSSSINGFESEWEIVHEEEGHSRTADDELSEMEPPTDIGSDFDTDSEDGVLV
jgi:hypothetical protein